VGAACEQWVPFGFDQGGISRDFGALGMTNGWETRRRILKKLLLL
jgi:hypothetical protein